jgi:crotonobetainyl-CoA:carnitine CoA-transferase CaiB-like acyl-CoA transferase
VRPLEDIRIVALEQYGAGPFGSLHLADLGAQVLKIEDPATGGDVGRYIPPFADGEDSLFFETFNRNKRSLSLDVTNDAGRAVLEDLVRASDAVYSNLRGDVPERLRIRYDDLKHVNPKIVCCSLSAFGMNGPRRAEPGYDYILQGIAGWMDLTGEPDGPPTKSGLSLVDYIGGIVAALSLVAGVHAARRDGTGMDCDVSLFDAAISMLTYPAVWHLNGGFEPERLSRSAHPSLVPFQLFEASDGWLVVGCAKEKFFARLAESIGRADLVADPRFKDFDARRQHRDELIPILDAALATRTCAEWIEVLTRAGVPCGPVNSVEQALNDPQTAARGMIVETDHPKFGRVRQPGSPVRVGDEPIPHRRAPLRNEDQDFVLRELIGYDAARIEELRAAGAFGK